jgi:hypothetical protein
VRLPIGDCLRKIKFIKNSDLGVYGGTQRIKNAADNKN